MAVPTHIAINSTAFEPIEDQVTATTICRRMAPDQLLKLCQVEKLRLPVTADTPQSELFELMVQAVVGAIRETGIKQFVNMLPTHVLQAMALRDEPDPVNHNKKPVLQKRVRENCVMYGVERYFFVLALAKQHIEEVVGLLSAVPVSDDYRAVCHQIQVLCNVVGMEAILTKCDVPFLRSLLQTFNLTAPEVKFSMAFAIATQTSVALDAVPAKPKKAAKESASTFSSVKLPLEKGITYQDIFQHYYQNELVQFCREHGLRSSGSKTKLINTILNYLNHGIVDSAAAVAQAVPGGAPGVTPSMEAQSDDENAMVVETQPVATATADVVTAMPVQATVVAPPPTTIVAAPPTTLEGSNIDITQQQQQLQMQHPQQTGLVASRKRRLTVDDQKLLEEQRRALLQRRVKVSEALAQIERIANK